MKKLLFTLLFFIAAPVYGQISVAEVVIEDYPQPELPILDIDLSFITDATSTATSTALETEATTTVVLEDELTATTTQEEVVEEVLDKPEMISETITIIPGSLSVTLSATPPAAPTVSSEGEVTLDDGLFNLIYTGFEEFVFKVFGL